MLHDGKEERDMEALRKNSRLLKDYAQMTLGALIAGAAFALFFLPHDIAPGGITGIATVLAARIPLGVGLLSFLLNVPLFLMGYRHVGWRFAVRSFIAMTLLSLFIDVLPHTDLSGDTLLASVFGGGLMGIGLGMVVRGGATTGGTDMAALLLHRHLSFLGIPAILLFIDGLVIVLAAAEFGVQAGCFALIACYVSSRAMDLVIKGFNTAMQFMIFTKEKDRIIKRIHGELDRGCTELSATGTYSQKPVGTLVCVVYRTEAARLKKLVYEEDPDAFVTVCDVHEAVGEGFSGNQE